MRIPAMTVGIALLLASRAIAQQTGPPHFDSPGTVTSHPAPADADFNGPHYHNHIKVTDNEGIKKVDVWVENAAVPMTVTTDCAREYTFKDNTQKEVVLVIITDCGTPSLQSVWVLVKKPQAGLVPIDIRILKDSGEVVTVSNSGGITDGAGGTLGPEDFTVKDGHLRGSVVIPVQGGAMDVVVDPPSTLVYCHFVFRPPPFQVAHVMMALLAFFAVALLLLTRGGR